VAGFIGPPAMNFIEAALREDGKRLEVADIAPLELEGNGIPAHGGKRIILGIRPEHFQLVGRERAAMPLVVDHSEILGADTLVHGHLGRDRVSLTVRLPAVQHVAKNDILHLSVHPKDIHVFHRDTGLRLEGPAAV